MGVRVEAGKAVRVWVGVAAAGTGVEACGEALKTGRLVSDGVEVNSGIT